MAETQIAVTDAGMRLSLTQRLGVQLQRTWLRCLLLVLIGAAVRAPALSGELIWDDQFLARDNPFIKSPLLILEAFRHHLFLDSFSAHYRPVQNISFIFDYFFWNTNTYGFHLTNVLLHVASGLLLYCLLSRLLPSLCRLSAEASFPGNRTRAELALAAWIVALLWIVHPVHSAAVDYISGRADSLAFLFACGGWLLLILARERSNHFFRYSLYMCAAASSLLALCSREIACIWFALFLLHLFLFEKKISTRAKLLTLFCSLAVITIYAGLRQLPERRDGPGPSSQTSAPIHATLMFRALGDYTRLMIFPANLHMERSVAGGGEYGRNQNGRNAVALQYLSIAGLLSLAAMIGGSCRRGTGQPLRIFGASWFILGYLPISNLVELNATAGEHWLYLPSVGFLLFLAGCALDLPVHYRKGIASFACLAVIGLSVRSVNRSSDWVTAESFYSRTIAAGGNSVRVSVNLGLIYSTRHEYAKAEALFRQVLQVMPDYSIARNNLADVLSRQGKKAEAEAMFTASTEAAVETRKEQPRTWIAALNGARLRHAEKDDASALAILAKARTDYPHIWEIISLEAEITRATQGPDAALHLVESFARENWWHYGASLALGRLWAEKGDGEKAKIALRHASRLDVHATEALNLMAGMSVRQNRFQEAYESQWRAVARQPDQPGQYLLLSDILEKMGRDDEARAMLAQVSRMQAIAEAHSVLN